ncbi:MAG TPA: hypothetical protein PLK31_04970 [Chloroflexota bacterium]|nr:hypothetical protein [Chloroflexota bacterium]
MSPELNLLLGFSPRADVLLEREDGTRRLWIEFEISRADPVANHAKFATTQLFQPQTAQDVFISMISPAVDRGRHNLAANMIWVMRHTGMEAYQTVLLPHTSPPDIRRLNHLEVAVIMGEAIMVEPEIARALTISQSLMRTERMNIHFVANLMEVMLNLRQWNQDLATEAGQSLWEKRTVTYFVFDPRSRRFAPSKFCAYISIPQLTTKTTPISGSSMTIQDYVQIDRTELIFDGGRAVNHLTRNLAMGRASADERPDILAFFDSWLSQQHHCINVHPAGPIFLLPPAWA